MPPTKIQITDEDIAHAENILFSKTGEFDDERKKFIKNLNTIDLQAVPGSGKTTALLAKLLILERHLPFEDGSGILAISHTNAAIDEIKKRIGLHCPKLFVYPNFVGTIQTFTDTFLAIPFACSYFHTTLPHIDTSFYQEQLWENFQFIYWDKNAGEPGKWFWSRHIKQAKEQADSEDEAREICKRAIEDEVKNLYFDFCDEKIKRASTEDAVLVAKGNPKYIAIVKLIKDIVFERGIISFDYAYHLGETFIGKAPIISRLLQKRFRYVFVDEMQDMDNHQYNLLEQIFYDSGNSPSVYQRIGDKNQAIFSRDIKFKEIWNDRSIVIPITGSCRLTPKIAKVVESFGKPRVQIDGRNLQKDALSPHVVVFDDNSVLTVLPKYCELVKKYIDDGKIPKDCKHPFKAIAWRKGDDGKFGLKNYWPEYETNISKSKVDYPNLKSYLLFAKNGGHENSFDRIHKNVLNAFLRVLRLEQIQNPDSKTGRFSTSNLQKYLKDRHADFYDTFQLSMFHWCRNIYLGKIDDAFIDIKQFIPQLLNCFGKKLEKSISFVNDESMEKAPESPDKSEKNPKKDNIYRCEKTGIEVEVGTVHSVKGETHTTTLYLESYYQKDGKGKKAKSYEFQRLKEQFAGREIPDDTGDRTRQSARMVYVGFSRPTHLLCFAIHKDRYDEKVFRENGWEAELLFEAKS